MYGKLFYMKRKTLNLKKRLNKLFYGTEFASSYLSFPKSFMFFFCSTNVLVSRSFFYNLFNTYSILYFYCTF